MQYPWYRERGTLSKGGFPRTTGRFGRNLSITASGQGGIWSKGTRLCDQWHESLGVDLGVAIEIVRKTLGKYGF